MLLPPTLSARDVRLACLLYCPLHPHRHDMTTRTPSPRGGKQQGQVDGRHREAGVRISSADWFKAGVARQLVGPISLGIAPRACMILSTLLPPSLLLLLLLLACIILCKLLLLLLLLILSKPLLPAVIMCAEGYGVGFDTLSFFGWFGSTSLGARYPLDPLPRPCLHARGGVTLADVTAGCCSHLPYVPWRWG